jgi:hypothetical protein
VGVLHVDDVGVADIVGHATVVASRDAIDALTERARRAERAAATAEEEVSA